VFDIKWIRDNPDAFDAGLNKRRIQRTADPKPGDVLFADQLLALDETRRRIVTRLQEAQARRNAASKEIGKAKGAKDEAKAAALMAEVAALKETMAKGEEEQRAADKALHDALSVIPNIPREDVPEGKDEHGNVEQRKAGAPPKLVGVNKPLQHFEIGERLGLMDFETAAKLSGARFVVLKGALARMERALGAFMLDIHTGPEKGGIGGYTEIAPPIMVRDDAMFGTAQLPKFMEDQFATKRNVDLGDEAIAELGRLYAELKDRQRKIEETEAQLDAGTVGLNPADLQRNLAAYKYQLARIKSQVHALVGESELWLIPTAEVPLTNLVREKITDEFRGGGRG
jgi:seryl-tRNA synthetase